MTSHWANLKPFQKEKTPLENFLEWAKAHQEFIAVGGILILLLGIGIPYFFHNQVQKEKDAEGVLSLGQYYLHAAVDPKNGPFKTEVDKYQQSLQTFQRITTDYSGTKTAKLARYYTAKCEYSLGQYTQAYASFESASQELRGLPFGDEAYLGKILCLEAQNQWLQASTLGETFINEHPDSFIIDEMRLVLSDIYLKNNNKPKALEMLKIEAQSKNDNDWVKEAARRLKQLQS
jgi:tetratricopeptide (TPR) repeat protein